jgi:DNA-binding HxlR family transcriptional regulator
MKTQNPRELSPVEVCFRLVGGKYKGAILWYLAKKGPLRFSELIKYLPQVNPKMLTQQLRTMEWDRIVSRTVYPEVPPRVEYTITDFGLSLFPLIQAAHQWGLDYVRGLSEEQAPHTPKSRPCYQEGWRP